METRCYAIDTWKGDAHAGFYGEEVFRDVQNHNDKQYSAFSTLIRSSFDEASRHFRKRSIDLLHIDGRHFYDDVKHDFETWQPKLSSRAVVIFHDTNVRERDFGVFTLWKELCEGRPHFEFFHGHGLGVLGIGSNLPDRILALFAARGNVEASTQIRAAYSRLGSAVTFQVRAEQVRLVAENQVSELNRGLAARDSRISALDQALLERNKERGALQQALAERDARVSALDQALSESSNERGTLQQFLAERDANVSILDQALSESNNARGALQQALAERDAKVSVLDQALSESNNERSALQQTLAERNAKVSVLDQALLERNNERSALQQALAERAAKVSALHQVLLERDSERGILQQALVERDTTVSALDQVLSERNSERSMLQQALAERDAKISALDQVLSQRDSKRGALQRALAEWTAKVSALNQAFSERNDERGTLRSRVVDLEASLAGRSAEGARLDADLNDARKRATFLESQLDARELELQVIRASTSWRLSRPIRRIGYAWPRLAQLYRRALNSLSGASIFNLGKSAKLSLHDLGGTACNRQNQSRLLQFNQLNSLADRRQSVPDDRETNGKILEESGLLDEDAYRSAAGIDAATNAAEHYLTVGWRQMIEPGANFEGRFLDPYFRSAGFDGPPVMTYIRLRAAGWPVYATREQAERIASLIRASNLFDAAAYAARHSGIGELDPALHYVIVGEQMGVMPSDGFDPDYYGDRYPDIVRSRINRLAHYLTSGLAEGRRPVSKARTLSFDLSRIDPKRETVLLVIHEASRTGAPILAYNVAVRLRHKYNVVAVLLAGGELVEDFDTYCAAVIGPLAHADWHPGEAKHLVKHILANYRVAYAIVNSIASWIIVPSLARAFVPVVLLVHEFASYTRPKSAMRQGLEWATEIVFSADLVARSAHQEHPSLKCRPIHILPQGRCDLPPGPRTSAAPGEPRDLRQVFRPPGAEDALVVLGCGFVHIRKGVDLFLSCAAAVAALRPKRVVRFVWIGEGYDPEKDATYSCYLADQIARSGLEEMVAIIDAIADLEPAYAMADFFFLSSRLDPLPNVTIEAALRGIPVICFEGASGMAELTGANATTKQCVVPHLDVQAAAQVIAELASDDARRRQVGDTFRSIGQATFNMNRYVSSLDALGNSAVKTMRQRVEDFGTLRDDPLFDASFFLPFDAAPVARSEAIIDFLARWTVVGTNTRCGSDYFFRRPCAGFHPQIYAHEHAGECDMTVVNPLAHFIRSGKPDGPWSHDVITPASSVREQGRGSSPACAIHAHFHYPELAEDFLRKISVNGSRCDLLLSTDRGAKARILRKASSQYRRGEVSIRVAPNRGRDIGAFLSAFGEDIVARYDIVGHVHSKRTLHAIGSSDPNVGERWREFLWQNLLGDAHPMLDIIIARLTTDSKLGFVFADDPHLPEWDGNRQIADELAARMGIKEPLPPFFDFPVGTMFWARTAALKPLFNLKLDWNDYPEEPLSNDGTILHALERLLPFVAQHAGYRLAVTNVPRLTW
jgi:glycosyltransferase involved in cell wall biosynthesis/septal ring factor EnvC (AmiA/AmiB activator)